MPHKHEGLSSDAQYAHRKIGTVIYTVFPALGDIRGENTQVPGYSEVTSFVYLASLQANVTLSQNKSYDVPKD